MNLEKTFNTWYNPLKLFLNSKEFIKIGRQVNKDREHYTVIPEYNSDILFRVFNITDYNKLSIIILGQTPYSNPIDAYDGLAFSNSTLISAQPSLLNILREVEEDIYDSFDLNTIGDLDLSRWSKQGILLLNTAMTVKQHLPESHIDIWNPFLRAVIGAINQRNDIVWLLWGSAAKSYKKYIRNSSHVIIESGHPSPQNLTVVFRGTKPFSKANFELSCRNKQIIKW